MEMVSGVILSVVNFVLYTFWFALLVFVIFVLYMTFATIKGRELKQKSEAKKLAYKKYYRSLLYSVPLIAVIITTLLYDIC